MLPTKVLLALSGLLLAQAYKIEIDVKDDSITQAGDQIPVMEEEPTFNATVSGEESTLLPQLACPGTCAGTATCKAGDGSIRIASNGSPFYLSCGKYTYNGNYNKYQETAPNFEACIDSCAKKTTCMAANYEASSKTCYKLSNYNYPGTDNRNWEVAYKMTTTRAVTASCPQHDGQLIRTEFRTYKIYCGYNLATDEITKGPFESLEGCADRCDETPGCISVVRDIKKTTCYFKSKFGVPGKDKAIESNKEFLYMIPLSGVSKAACCAETKEKSVLEIGAKDEL